MNNFFQLKSRSVLLAGLFMLFAAFVPSSAVRAQGPEVLKVKESPCLWVDKEVIDNLKDMLHTPYMKNQAKLILKDADMLINFEPIKEREAEMYMIGTRAIASHLQTLTAAWVLTHEQKYRDAAMKHLANLLNWTHISCEARKTSGPTRKFGFCLTYGEHCADIALMYDVFRPDITPAEQKVFFDLLDKFYLEAALRAVERSPWWAFKQWSNWNGVCAGGMGLMALAFYNDRPECRKLIPFVEKSLGEYFKSYIANGGGSHEGTGYWNYGMHYAMRYLLSWENATGKKHPAFEIPELRTSLNFPLDFTKISFGDNDGWHPTGMFFKLAKRLNNPSAALRCAAYLPDNPQPNVDKSGRSVGRFARTALGDVLYAANDIPTAEEMAKLKEEHMKHKDPVARVYKGLEWGALADDSAFPTLRLSARGGSSKIAGHGHIDIMSFLCQVNGETMIDFQQDGGYIGSTFSGRGHDIYSRSAAGKSTLLIDGVTPMVGATCKETTVEQKGDLYGIRINGGDVYMPRWKNARIYRLFLLVDGKYILVIDGAPGHYIESRFHTYATPTVSKDGVVLKKGDVQLAMSFASYGEGMLQQSFGMPTSSKVQTNILRWMSPTRAYESLPKENGFHVTALNPGKEKLGLSLEKQKDGGFAITVTGKKGYQRVVNVTNDLRLK